MRTTSIQLTCFLFLGVAACGSPTTQLRSSADAGVSVGTVPADIRDVERDGEGLVATTFGAYPERMPDWMRARSVLSLLQQVWARGKKANPHMPKAEVLSVDTAIADLSTAISAQEQEKAAYAANAVGLAVPKVFDSFHPDAPIGIVRMDAMFRQVGLDAHFNHVDAVAADLASLKGDWTDTKDAVAKKAPQCHRVGGTATVAGDIDNSLLDLDSAVSASDVMTGELESENGALEIDILELLYDCPPDNAAPKHGLGAKCTSNAQCDPDRTCDTSDASGKCGPDPAKNKIGIACNSTAECGTDPRAACQTAAGDSFPGGYCFMEPCNDIEICPGGATCVAIGGETPGCFKTCASDDDCRRADGYVCQVFLTSPPKGFGPSNRACAFACTRDADCQSPLTCNVTSGKCTP